MDTKTWIIIGLVVLAYFQFSSPAKTHSLLEPVFGRVQNFISNNNPMDKLPTAEDEGDGCPEEVDYVCGSDGVTYDNACRAALADILEITPGEC